MAFWRAANSGENGQSLRCLGRGLGGLCLLLLGACSTEAPPVTLQQATIDYDILLNLPHQPISFSEQVQPVLEQRCVVCHGCYDAPCQLKLSSHEGLLRGASPQRVYDGSRILAAQPTRLFIDAHSPQQWREKGFHAVLAPSSSDDPAQRLRDSVMYRMLRLKQRNPQARVGMLDSNLDTSLDRKQSCATIDEFDEFEQQHPDWGMPYAMPNLSDAEYRTLVQWLAQGAQTPPPAQPSPEAVAQIAAWEAFFNQPGAKQQLVSRYIYEHLFAGHLHFRGGPEREFYRLVRSFTPPGQPIDEIPTVRPYDDPGQPFYYRLRLLNAVVVAKDHVVYELSDARMARYRSLFLEPNYQVDAWLATAASRSPEIASNPFKVFAAIPLASRYRFLLDDARFFIEGFIKGPVCRGQIALNVIEDHFWVMFFAPEADMAVDQPGFLDSMSDYLQLPSADGNTLGLLKVGTEYARRQRQYMSAKTEHFKGVHATELTSAMDYIWDGDGDNPNAALTVFRHFDSASVTEGLVGDYPDTAWIIDYPQFERIHYLLVAGFDVFGNVGHQLNTRLYMDFLRMEGEDHFLAFLPVSQRKAIRDSWYQGIRDGLEHFGDDVEWLQVESVVGYQTGDPQRELYQALITHLGPLAIPPGYADRCTGVSCDTAAATPEQRRVDEAMRRVAAIQGEQLLAFPDLAFVRVRGGDDADDLAYTLVRNRAYYNVTSIFTAVDQIAAADLAHDRLTVLPWLEGSYPNFFFDIELDAIDAFVTAYSAVATRDDYERFVALYGVRRTNTNFWPAADWFRQQSGRERPLRSGIYDLNRYLNR